MGNLLQLAAPLIAIFNLVFFGPVYNILMLVYDGVHSFGLAVIILTLLLRGALIPLTRKQLASSRQMQVVAPRMKELQAQYRSDPQGLMAAQRALYKEYGVSPLSGCLPLLVQMPFLYALYGAFNTVLPLDLARINRNIYPFLPKLSAVPDLHFLWLSGSSSLAMPDPLHILPIVAGILTFIQLRMAMPVRKKQPGGATDATAQATSTMQYIMPLITVFIGWRFAAGLALYWTISTGFSAVQQYFISGGFGSLFVGIPGLEHLVPPPQDSPSPAVRTAVASARANAVVAAAPADTGLRGMLAQMRDTLLPTPHPISPSEAPPRGGRAAGQGQPPSRPAAPRARPTPEEPATPPPTAERHPPRAPRTGPVLLKPPTAPGADRPPEAFAPPATPPSTAPASATPPSAAPSEREMPSAGTTPPAAPPANGTGAMGANGSAANGSAANGSAANGSAANGSAANGAQPPARPMLPPTRPGVSPMRGSGAPGGGAGARRPASRHGGSAHVRGNRQKGGR